MIEITAATVSELVAESEVLAQRTLTVSDPQELSSIGESISAIRKELETRSMLRDTAQRQRRTRVL